MGTERLMRCTQVLNTDARAFNLFERGWIFSLVDAVLLDLDHLPPPLTLKSEVFHLFAGG